MINLAELPYLAENLVAENKGKFLVGALTGSLVLLNHLAGGGPVSEAEMSKILASESSARSSNSPARAPAGISSPAETNAKNTRTVVVNGISYSSTPSAEYPQGCATSQITANVLTEQELKQKGLKRGDPMYMKNNSGKGNATAWSCQNGQRVPNSPPPLVPGRRTWH